MLIRIKFSLVQACKIDTSNPPSPLDKPEMTIVHDDILRLFQLGSTFETGNRYVWFN